MDGLLREKPIRLDDLEEKNLYFWKHSYFFGGGSSHTFWMSRVFTFGGGKNAKRISKDPPMEKFGEPQNPAIFEGPGFLE